MKRIVWSTDFSLERDCVLTVFGCAALRGESRRRSKLNFAEVTKLPSTTNHDYAIELYFFRPRSDRVVAVVRSWFFIGFFDVAELLSLVLRGRFCVSFSLSRAPAKRAEKPSGNFVSIGELANKCE